MHSLIFENNEMYLDTKNEHSFKNSENIIKILC